MEMFSILSRWTHIGTAIVLVGGTVFLRFVLGPAAAQLPDAEHAKLKELVMAKWKRFVHGGIGLFVASGIFNYCMQIQKHRGDKLYHALMGTKILIALGIFVLASALVGRSKSFEGIRAKSKLWQTIMILLAAVVVGISGVVKFMPPTSGG